MAGFGEGAFGAGGFGGGAVIETITATLVSTDSPQSVQVVVTGITAGQDFTVEGTTSAGARWFVPGGRGITPGGQIVLMDNRTALNMPIVYELTVGGTVYTSAPVTVVYLDGEGVIQSLNGQTTVEFVWRENDLPNEPAVYSRAFTIPGRTRPPVRIAGGGDGAGSLSIRTNRSNTENMRALLRTGSPVVIRTNGLVRDFPAVEIALITDAPNELWRVVTPAGMSTDRVWSLSYLLVDDPEPGTALSAFTWDDLDEAMSTRTWSDGTDSFDALFSSMTWDPWDAIDWDQYK